MSKYKAKPLEWTNPEPSYWTARVTPFKYFVIQEISNYECSLYSNADYVIPWSKESFSSQTDLSTAKLRCQQVADDIVTECMLGLLEYVVDTGDVRDDVKDIEHIKRSLSAQSFAMVKMARRIKGDWLLVYTLPNGDRVRTWGDIAHIDTCIQEEADEIATENEGS